MVRRNLHASFNGFLIDVPWCIGAHCSAHDVTSGMLTACDCGQLSRMT